MRVAIFTWRRYVRPTGELPEGLVVSSSSIGAGKDSANRSDGTKYDWIQKSRYGSDMMSLRSSERRSNYMSMRHILTYSRQRFLVHVVICNDMILV